MPLARPACRHRATSVTLWLAQIEERAAIAFRVAERQGGVRADELRVRTVIPSSRSVALVGVSRPRPWSARRTEWVAPTNALLAHRSPGPNVEPDHGRTNALPGAAARKKAWRFQNPNLLRDPHARDYLLLLNALRFEHVRLQARPVGLENVGSVSA